MRSKLPKAKVISHVEGVKTVWSIQWPSTMQKWGKTYIATTYPNSDLVFLETAAKRRPVSPLVGRKIIVQVRGAIDRAKSEATAA